MGSKTGTIEDRLAIIELLNWHETALDLGEAEACAGGFAPDGPRWWIEDRITDP